MTGTVRFKAARMLYSSTGKIFSCFKYSGSNASKVSGNLMLHAIANNTE